jgi:hypothetical protein
VTVTLTADGDKTAGTVRTDLSITGKPAQFGRGMISEVGGRILDSFADCLAQKLAPEPKTAPEPEAAPEPETVPDTAAGPENAAESEKAAEPQTAPKTSQQPKLAVVPEPESEPIDLLSVAGPSVARRIAPLLAAVLAVLAIVAMRRRAR